MRLETATVISFFCPTSRSSTETVSIGLPSPKRLINYKEIVPFLIKMEGFLGGKNKRERCSKETEEVLQFLHLFPLLQLIHQVHHHSSILNGSSVSSTRKSWNSDLWGEVVITHKEEITRGGWTEKLMEEEDEEGERNISFFI